GSATLDKIMANLTPELLTKLTNSHEGNLDLIVNADPKISEGALTILIQSPNADLGAIGETETSFVNGMQGVSQTIDTEAGTQTFALADSPQTSVTIATDTLVIGGKQIELDGDVQQAQIQAAEVNGSLKLVITVDTGDVYTIIVSKDGSVTTIENGIITTY